VSKAKTKEYAGKTIVPVRCEGFRGVSQSLGHHIANDAIRDWVFDKMEGKPARFELNALRRRDHSATTTSAATPGLRAFYWKRWACASSRSGRATARSRKLEATPSRQAQCSSLLSLDELHLAAHGRKYGTPWVEYNFFGPSKIAESLRKIASHFDETIKENAEKVIAKYQALCDAVIAKYRLASRGQDGHAVCRRPAVRAMSSAPMKTRHGNRRTGYEFGHNDDYQRTTHYVKDGTADL